MKRPNFRPAIFFGIPAFLLLASCGKQQSTANNLPPSNPSAIAGARIAYVDIDTFEAHYETLKSKKEEFKAQQEQAEHELERSAQQMQADYASVMKKQQDGTLTKSEAEAADTRLRQMNQSLETRKAAMSSQFQEKLDAFNKRLHQDMDAFLAEYTKAHNLDYVLSYSQANAQILYANKGYDITSDVIKGMNERAGKAESTKDTAKGK